MNDAPSYAPTEQERQARKDARQSHLDEVQQRAQDDTDRLFRMFGAAGAVSGNNILTSTREKLLGGLLKWP